MNKKTKNNLIFTLKFFIPLLIVVGLFLGGIGTGIITFEKPIKMTGLATATIEIDFGDGIVLSKTITLENSTVFDFLIELEVQGYIQIERTYWNTYDSYSIDSITYEDKKYEGDLNNYWAFLVNGEMAMEGANQIYVNNDDIITWKFVSF